jgi:mono/diheme cytochrome c family protein
MRLQPNLKQGACCLAFAASVLTTPVLAADARNGNRLAHRWCQPCHVVAANQHRPTEEAPPFATIASKPDFDPARVALFLLDPHGKMPDMSLTRVEAADLAAYIATLKR